MGKKASSVEWTVLYKKNDTFIETIKNLAIHSLGGRTLFFRKLVFE